LKRRRRGQASIVGLIVLLISVVLFVGLYPVLDSLIATVLPSADTLTAAVLRLFLPIVAIAILYSFIMYVIPQRQVPY